MVDFKQLQEEVLSKVSAKGQNIEWANFGEYGYFKGSAVETISSSISNSTVFKNFQALSNSTVSKESCS